MSMKLRFSDAKDMRNALAVLKRVGIEFNTAIPERGRIGTETMSKLARELHSREDVELTWTEFFPESLLSGKPAQEKNKPTKTYGVVVDVNGTIKVVSVSVAEIRDRFGVSAGRVSDASFLTVAREGEGWTDEDAVTLITIGSLVNKPIREIPPVEVEAVSETSESSSEGEETGEVSSDAEKPSESPDEASDEPIAEVKPRRSRAKAKAE